MNNPSLTTRYPEPAQQTWWHKPLIWATFVALLYVLREFFLVGFLTFLFCFIVRSAVGALIRRISPGQKSQRLDSLLTLVVFLGICLTLYGLGRFFVPPVIRQGKSLATQIKNLSAAEVQNMLLANTVGSWKFKQQFGQPTDPRYQRAFSEFQAAGNSGEGLYQQFPALHSRLEAEFEAYYEQVNVQHLQISGLSGTTASGRLEQWFLEIKAPQLYSDKSEYYLSRWEAEHASPEKVDELAKLRQQPDFESRRDGQIRQRIWADIKSDPVLLAQLKAEWARSESIEAWGKFRASSEYKTQFKKFYESEAKESANQVPIDYSFYQTLTAAYPQGKEAFLAAVHQHDQQHTSLAHQQFDFESATKLELGQQWWATSHAADWVRDHAAVDGPKVLPGLVQRIDSGFGELLRIPIQIVTALLLSIFMLIEWQGVKDGIASLRNTRVRPVYDEIAPGVIALGKLIGKSFQGQVIISFFNACFTLFALWLIGVEYKFVLALVVFVSSFIPVLGVILSGIPICAIAILQPEGSLLMALQVVVAIAIVHLIEGMILSPRIIGKIGHLHPVLVIAILLVAEKFFGMWGLVLGVPVAIYIIRVVILNSPIPGIYDPSGTSTR
ncbi:MAG: AI-2E family transporter [Pirellulales bacterium]